MFIHCTERLIILMLSSLFTHKLHPLVCGMEVCFQLGPSAMTLVHDDMKYEVYTKNALADFIIAIADHQISWNGDHFLSCLQNRSIYISQCLHETCFNHLRNHKASPCRFCLEYTLLLLIGFLNCRHM